MPRKSPKRRGKRSKRRRKSPKKRSKRRRKFKMQSQTYNRDDFKEGDKFEKITWHWIAARHGEKGAYVDRKNKLYPWYPRVISVHPSYIYVFISVRPNRYSRIYYNLIKDVVWEGGIVKSLPKRPKSAMKKGGGRAKRRSPRKKPSSPRKVKAAKKIQKYVRKRSGRRKNKFKMQEFIRWRSKPRSREIEERKYPIGRWPYYLKDETRVFRDELGRNFNKGDFRIGDVIEAINIDGHRPLYDCSILSFNDNELALLAERPGLYHGKNRYIVSYDDIREVIFRKSPKRPKSAMKKSGGRAKRRSPRKKARSPRKKPSSPRKVKAAKKIQKYVRKRSGRRKNKFKMQGQNLVRVFRDDLGRDFNKTDFYKNQDLEVIDSIYFWPQWSVRVKSPKDNNLEIYTELGEVLLIPYASIREVIYKQSPKRPKSAMKKGRKYKMQDDAEYVTITVNDLGRNFNKDDFYVGQIVDIRRNGRGWSGYKHKIKNIDNSGVDWSLMEAINGHESSTNYNSINSVRYYKEKKRPKSAMKKGRKYKMQGAAGGVTVTVNELGRDFNKNDFKVGQKIDIRRKLRSSTLLSSGIPSGQVWGVDWWLAHATVMSVENSKLSCTMGNRAFKIDYNSIHSVRYHEMPKRPKSAMKKGGKYKIQDNASGVVTVNNLGRNFNKNDFKVGQKIDIRRKLGGVGGRSMGVGGWWTKNLTILRVENSKLFWKRAAPPWPEYAVTNINSIHSVKYPKIPKRPKSAMKKGGGQVKRKSPSKKARSPRKKPLSPRKVKAAKKIQKYVRKRSGRRKNKFKMQNNANYVIVTVDELGRDFNKDDFKVGQKIDIIRKGPLAIQNPPATFWDGPLNIVKVDDSKLTLTEGSSRAYVFGQWLNSIHSVRYHEMPKRPKSAMKKGRKYKMNKKKSTAKKADRHPHSRKPSIEDFVEVGDFDLSLADTFDQVSDDYYHHAGKRYTLPDGTLSSARYLAKLKGFGQSPLTGNDIFEIELVNRDDGKNAGQGTHLTYKIWFQPGPDGRWWYSDAVKRAQDPQGVGRAPPFMGVWYKYNMGENKFNMQDNANYITVTVDELGRDFNKDDFKVGQKIDILPKDRHDWWENLPVKGVENEYIMFTWDDPRNISPQTVTQTYYNLIRSVRYHKIKKRPKSAMKKGKIKRRSPSSPRKVKAAKKIQKYVRKRSGRRKSKFKMQNICKCKSGGKCCCGPKCRCKNCPCKN